MRIGFKSLTLLFFVALAGCSNGKSKIYSGCITEKIPMVLCECTYNELSKTYSDSEIKEYHEKVEEVDDRKTSPEMLSPNAKKFVFDYYDTAQYCLTKNMGVFK